MKYRALMVQGTSSGAGKSIVVTALCRIFFRQGIRVCPFKAQNMSLNARAGLDGEISLAQWIQAQAAKLSPSYLFNPILLKPDRKGVHLIIRGKPAGYCSIEDYWKRRKEHFRLIRDCIAQLKNNYELIIAEGAGSPAEVNLRKYDLANLGVAELLDAEVLLVADIERGGALASIVGTLELLPPTARRRIKAILINKFRGDISLLEPAIKFLERRTGIRILGVLPYWKEISLPEEDSLFEEKFNQHSGLVDIAVLKYPHISNFSDFQPLVLEPIVNLRYVRKNKDFGSPDLLILPGSRNSGEDLKFIIREGLRDRIFQHYAQGKLIFAICAGMQMLGKKILDPNRIEGKSQAGLGLLALVSKFSPEKIVREIEGIHIESKRKIKGYELHHGISKADSSYQPLFKLSDGREEGICTGNIWASYIHGLFDQDGFRHWVLRKIAQRKGLRRVKLTNYNLDEMIDRLANEFKKNIDFEFLEKLIYA